jgi:hypothetical protein
VYKDGVKRAIKLSRQFSEEEKMTQRLSLMCGSALATAMMVSAPETGHSYGSWMTPKPTLAPIDMSGGGTSTFIPKVVQAPADCGSGSSTAKLQHEAAPTLAIADDTALAELAGTVDSLLGSTTAAIVG